jgi:hypothetical protein
MRNSRLSFGVFAATTGVLASMLLGVAPAGATATVALPPGSFAAVAAT